MPCEKRNSCFDLGTVVWRHNTWTVNFYVVCHTRIRHKIHRVCSCDVKYKGSIKYGVLAKFSRWTIWIVLPTMYTGWAFAWCTVDFNTHPLNAADSLKFTFSNVLNAMHSLNFTLYETRVSGIGLRTKPLIRQPRMCIDQATQGERGTGQRSVSIV